MPGTLQGYRLRYRVHLPLKTFQIAAVVDHPFRHGALCLGVGLGGDAPFGFGAVHAALFGETAQPFLHWGN